MFIPRLSFTKYVSRMDLAFLTDSLERLSSLHPDYQGLVLPGDSRPKPIEEAAGELLAFLEKETDARKGFICRHSVSTSASCGDFSRDITFASTEDNEGKTPLLLALGNSYTLHGYDYDDSGAQRLAMIRLLLTHGADVNAQNDQGQTALMLASHMAYSGYSAHWQQDRRAKIRLLRQFGADTHLKDRQGKTAVRYLNADPPVAPGGG